MVRRQRAKPYEQRRIGQRNDYLKRLEAVEMNQRISRKKLRIATQIVARANRAIWESHGQFIEIQDALADTIEQRDLFARKYARSLEDSEILLHTNKVNKELWITYRRRYIITRTLAQIQAVLLLTLLLKLINYF
jgi:hypothetical protein